MGQFPAIINNKSEERRAKMTEQLCPVCGCTIVGAGYEKEGVKYCCKSCASASGSCECGCCHPLEEKEDEG